MPKTTTEDIVSHYLDTFREDNSYGEEYNNFMKKEWFSSSEVEAIRQSEITFLESIQYYARHTHPLTELINKRLDELSQSCGDDKTVRKEPLGFPEEKGIDSSLDSCKESESNREDKPSLFMNSSEPLQDSFLNYKKCLKCGMYKCVCSGRVKR